MVDWELKNGAIIERPRAIDQHPLLDAIYRRHDELISRYAVDGRDQSLEIAFGTHSHPDADIGVEAFHDNSRDIIGITAITADARSLPFRDETFETIIGRRFLHHVPCGDRGEIIREAARVLQSSGRLVLLEGTPGLYRRITKEIGFRLGLLGENTDEYGHLTAIELEELVESNGFDIIGARPLGSPLMPLSILTAPWSAKLASIYNSTQWVTWWTLIVAEPTTESQYD